jgi:hypothetical protein
MSAALHIADNYNDVVDVITSLTAIYERTISVEPTLQQATNKQQEHIQSASKLYHSLLPLLYGCSAIELSDLQPYTYHFTFFCRRSRISSAASFIRPDSINHL